VTFHHPAVLAKRAAAVDHVSGGRAVLGIGGRLAGERAPRHRRRAAATLASG
jgi:alkanesulfonate monooxygenase SsuD/methylene tetrahydromethanopterin reductase-like flavin-dependent oxidoreductase (luciferase family)